MLALGARLAAALAPGLVVYLMGDLGMGKTTLARGESCREPFLAARKDQRFCGPGCGSRERVRRHRRVHKDKA